MAVQRPHDADPREHGRPVMLCDQQQRLHRGLPFRDIVFCLGQFGDVERGVAERDQRLALRRRDWFVENFACQPN